MAKIEFTAKRIADHACDPGKTASFRWDSVCPSLGLRTAAPSAKKPGGAKSFIFQAKLNGEVIRITIGRTYDWSIPDARTEARRLMALVDSGQDPRQVKADKLAAEQAEREAKAAEAAAQAAKQMRESVTLGQIWEVYCADRSPLWSELHRRDHASIIQRGGEQRKRSHKLTEAGPLASLAGERLADLTAERIEVWAKRESKARPTRARLALRLLKACLFWCATHREYSGICPPSVAQSKRARESLGKPAKKNDVLQREQLPAWFAGVRQISNPVISSYLQTLLLTGARREELASLKWEDIDFRWASMKLSDKVEDFRMVPLTPYVSYLLASLPRRNEYVFSSPTAASGRLTEPSIAHRKACAVAGLDVSLHGLRRSFATLAEWTEMPAGIAAQIQGHAPQGVREQNYIRRPLDLLRMWHIRFEEWVLQQAGISFDAQLAKPGLKVVPAN